LILLDPAAPGLNSPAQTGANRDILELLFRPNWCRAHRSDISQSGKKEGSPNYSDNCQINPGCLFCAADKFSAIV